MIQCSDGESTLEADMTKGIGNARAIEANRTQLSWNLTDLDAWLAADHLARTFWAFTATVDPRLREDMPFPAL
jgi:hypothetical protein